MKDIVVGMDGSKSAAAALKWALAEATLHGGRATALLAWSWLDQYHADAAIDFSPTYTEDDARAALASWVEDAVGTVDAVELAVTCDLPATALLERGAEADLVVVGARGAGGFDGLLVGSVTDPVVERARTPVAVVRAPLPTTHGPIVVGVDGSKSSLDALRWAAAEAAARDVELQVVHAWHLPTMVASAWVPVVEPTLADAREWSAEVLADAMREPALAGVRATSHLPAGGAARALLDCAKEASLLVVGSRGHGHVAGWLLGSVSRQVVHHARCPVIVV